MFTQCIVNTNIAFAIRTRKKKTKKNIERLIVMVRVLIILLVLRHLGFGIKLDMKNLTRL